MAEVKTVEVDLDYRGITASGKAYMAHDGDKMHFLPISLVEISSDNKTFLMPEWLAYEKGLI